jgi:hypothetical protein
MPEKTSKTFSGTFSQNTKSGPSYMGIKPDLMLEMLINYLPQSFSPFLGGTRTAGTTVTGPGPLAPLNQL